MSSNVAKLKKKAAEFEQKKQFDKALALYIQILDEAPGDDEADVALYNRVGDLLMREGKVGDAVTYYEKAVDLYAESGFFNNAIALCNKILRQSPGRSSIYYKLGKISAKKGFIADAKQNFLEYADRMQKNGQLDEAFRSLKEFADLCPDQDDIRIMLADQLSKKGRNAEALEQLQHLYEKFETEGRGAEMRATIDRMKAIDADAEPQTGRQPRQRKSTDLVFLDLGDDIPAPRRRISTPGLRAKAPFTTESKTEPILQLIPDTPSAMPGVTGDNPVVELTPESVGESVAEGEGAGDAGSALELESIEAEGAEEVVPIPGLDVSGSVPSVDAGDLDERPVAGLMVGEQFDAEDADETPALAGFEPSTLDPAAAAAALEDVIPDLDPPLSGMEFAELTFDVHADVEAMEPRAHDLALPGPLPSLDDVLPGVVSLTGEMDLIIPERDGLGPPPRRGSRELKRPGDVEIVLGADDLVVPDVVPETIPESTEIAEHPKPAPEPAAESVRKSTKQSMPEPVVEEVTRSAPERTPKSVPATVAQPTPPPPVVIPPEKPAKRHSHSELAQSVDGLRKRAEAEPGNWAVRRHLAEALLEDGERAAGLQELEVAMLGLEQAQDLDGARSVAEEIIRVNPNSVRHHQKRVEYAFRSADGSLLPNAYLELADALFRSGQADKARSVYQRVLELKPDDLRAQAALSAFGEPPRSALSLSDRRAPVGTGANPPAAPSAPAPSAAGHGRTTRRYTGDARRQPKEAEEPPPRARPEPPRVAPTADAPFVNLGDWLREEEEPRSTRMVVDEQEPSGDEAADFADMLRRFKQGVAANVAAEDSDSHYDLGVAYKEMGLLDESIAEFQKALLGPGRRVRTYEALGQCFLEKKQVQVAATILARALSEPGANDEQLVGVLYLLGYASEALHRRDAAVEYYHRVFAVDIQFRDVAERLTALEDVAK